MKPLVAITGGLGDIGQAIGKAFAAKGHAIAVCDLAENAPEDFSGHYFHADVRSEESVQAWFDAMEKEFGQPPTLVVVNAGVHCNNGNGNSIETSVEDWTRTIEVNWIKATIRQALNTKSRTIRIPAHKTHLPDIGPKVSQLDATYQGTYDSEIETQHEESHLSHKITNLISKLKPRQKEIVKMKFGIGCNEMKTIEIAKHLGITVQSVNGTIRNAIRIMKG